MTLEEYESKEEAYHAGYQNGKLIGTMEAVKHVVDKIKHSREQVKPE